MIKARKANRLATTGFYRIFTNPMYVFQVFLTLPGISLISNSWLVMSTVISVYIAYRFFVKEEYKHLKDNFGDAYRAYRKKVLISFI